MSWLTKTQKWTVTIEPSVYFWYVWSHLNFVFLGVCRQASDSHPNSELKQNNLQLLLYIINITHVQTVESWWSWACYSGEITKHAGIRKWWRHMSLFHRSSRLMHINNKIEALNEVKYWELYCLLFAFSVTHCLVS